MATKKYREEHREQIAEYSKRYRRDHPEGPRTRGSRAEYLRDWHARHPDKQKFYDARRPVKNSPSKVRSRKNYKLKHPERVTVSRRNHRAKRKNVPGSHTASDVKAIWIRQGRKCAVPNCCNPIATKGANKYQVDHVKAIANGGTNDPSNLQILCRQHNYEKRAHDEYEWALLHGRLFF